MPLSQKSSESFSHDQTVAQITREFQSFHQKLTVLFKDAEKILSKKLLSNARVFELDNLTEQAKNYQFQLGFLVSELSKQVEDENSAKVREIFQNADIASRNILKTTVHIRAAQQTAEPSRKNVSGLGSFCSHSLLRGEYTILTTNTKRKLTKEKISHKETGGGQEEIVTRSQHDHQMSGLLGNRSSGDDVLYDNDSDIFPVTTQSNSLLEYSCDEGEYKIVENGGVYKLPFSKSNDASVPNESTQEKNSVVEHDSIASVPENNFRRYSILRT